MTSDAVLPDQPGTKPGSADLYNGMIAPASTAVLLETTRWVYVLMVKMLRKGR